MKVRALHCIDFYKADHRRQYPEGTEEVYSNFTARSAKYAPVLSDFDNKVVIFGIQGFVKSFLIDLWNETFFRRPRSEVVAEYKRRMDTSLGEGAIPVDHIKALHDLGYLPISVKALPEGSRVNIRVPFLTITNTLPGFFWVTNMLETAISAELWKSCTAATIAFEYKRLLTRFADMTCDDRSFVPVQAHDFSFRGMGGIYDAASHQAAHLTSFIGTDTVPAIDYLEDYYNADSTKEVIGVSVPATEHSVMCMGEKESEIETFRRLITQLYPTGIVSIVSDTWDFWKVITEYAVELKDEILNRGVNALGLSRVVFRPDSGDPVKIICGDLSAPEGSPQFKGAVECLWDVFGGSVNSKGFLELNPRVGLIYGDSITLDRAEKILARLLEKGFASNNVVFGVGSYTYQHVTRDSFGFAIKATFGVVNGQDREIFKDPATDDGQKKSAHGLLRVEKEGNDYLLLDRQDDRGENSGELRVVFFNGLPMGYTTLHEIRQRLDEQLV